VNTRKTTPKVLSILKFEEAEVKALLLRTFGRPPESVKPL
jgi:hypothetical protein